MEICMEILTELQMIELKLDNKKRGICKKKEKDQQQAEMLLYLWLFF